MLNPEQVIPFLANDDPEVRQHAVLYLAGANDASPATADDFWRAIDALGPDKAVTHLDRLELMRQTGASVSRTLEALGTFEEASRPPLVRVVRSLDLDLVRRHRELMTRCRAWINRRIIRSVKVRRHRDRWTHAGGARRRGFPHARLGRQIGSAQNNEKNADQEKRQTCQDASFDGRRVLFHGGVA